MNNERRTLENGDDESEDFSDSTCSSCCYSDASIPEWDNSIQENGELFFLKCSPIIPDVRPNSEQARSTVVRSKSNKLATFLRKPKLKKSKNVLKEKKYDSTSLPQSGSEDKENRSWDGLDNQSSEPTMSVLFLNLASIDSSESTIADTFYSFPQPRDNVIYSIRGALMTLYHHLPKLVCEKLESSIIFVKEEAVQLIYVGDQKGLMILACPENRCSMFNFKQLGINIKHYLIFRYGSLNNAFSNSSHHVNLNQFFGNLFIKLLSCKFLSSTWEVHNSHPNERRSGTRFEETFIYPRALSISHDLMSKIHEKLNELEANDFGDLSEDHYGCQRLFLITGTCLYFKGSLVVSHLHPDDLVDINSFLRLNDILDLTVTSVMESLIVWQEVYLTSGNSENIRSFSTCNKRWFLLIVGKDHCLLVAVLETGGCAVNNTETSRPDELYVDQVQDTLNDILHLGLLDEVGQYEKNTSSSPIKTRRKSSCRSADSSTLNLSQVFNGTSEDTFSESVSRTTSSAISDEVVPVLGRRAQRLQQLSHSSSIYTLSQSNLSDSDLSDCDTTGSSQANSSIGSRSFSKLTPPSKRIIHGDEKALLHYVNLRFNKGVIYSMDTFNLDASRRYLNVMNQFELSAQRIHSLLTRKEDSNGVRSSRNSLVVKECGTLYEYCGAEDEEEKKSNASTSYWSVGRKFDKPNLGEIYVCYDDRTPQNMVEIAFRLASTS